LEDNVTIGQDYRGSPFLEPLNHIESARKQTFGVESNAVLAKPIASITEL